MLVEKESKIAFKKKELDSLRSNALLKWTFHYFVFERGTHSQEKPSLKESESMRCLGGGPGHLTPRRLTTQCVWERNSWDTADTITLCAYLKIASPVACLDAYDPQN